MGRVLFAAIIVASLALTVFNVAVKFDTSFTLLMAIIALAIVATLGRGRVRESLFTLFFASSLTYSLFLYVIDKDSKSLFVFLALIFSLLGLLLPFKKRKLQRTRIIKSKPIPKTAKKKSTPKKSAKSRSSKGRKSRRRRPK